MKRYILILLSTILVHGAWGQSVTVQAPDVVHEGEVFEVTYSVNASVSSFKLGQMPDGIRLEGGPSTSSQSSLQIINGHTSSMSRTMFTYYFSATKTGAIILPGATAVVGGRSVSSQAAKINVEAGNGSNHAAPSQGAPQTQGRRDVLKSNDNLYIKPVVAKKSIKEQEALVVTYKIYTRLRFSRFQSEMPNMNDFHVEKLNTPSSQSLGREGDYFTGMLEQYVMYPKKCGRLQIPNLMYSIVVTDNSDPFMPSQRRVYVETEDLAIDVASLPAEPSGFSGAVGDFTISAQLDKNQVKAGDPVSMRVIVDGVGNLKLLAPPAINLPNDFDTYAPKSTEKTTLTANGYQGSMIFDYTIVPRKEGNYQIPAVEFTYFDSASSSYKTIKTAPMAVKVLKGDGMSSYSDFSGAEAASDIRGLMTGESSLSQRGEHFFGSAAYFIWLLLPVMVFIVLFIVFRKHAIENANIVKKRGKKANKVATRRLKDAASLMRQNRQSEFYDEVLRALWGYVSDKLNIPVEHLSKDNISDCLEQHGINYATIDTFIQAIDECEYARYAPGDPKGMMEHVYAKAVAAITDIDNMLKNNNTSHAGTSVVGMLLMMLLCSAGSYAATKQHADGAYAKGNYAEAIKEYNEVMKQGVSAELYYNLGNAYFRSGKMPQAVLSYERARRLAPGNADIRFNLKLAQSKTIDKINPEEQMFFTSWYYSVINFTSADNWAVLSVVCVILLLVSLVMYLFGQSIPIIRSSFYLALCSVMLFVVSTLCAFLQHYEFNSNEGAVIMSASVELKKTPADSSSETAVLHEGTSVEIIDDGMKEWIEVRLADGREGWVKPSQIEKI